MWAAPGCRPRAAAAPCRALTRADGSWSRTLNQVQTRFFNNVIEGSKRLRVRIMHPMDTGLVAGTPAFYIESLQLVDGADQVWWRLSPHEPVSENPILTFELPHNLAAGPAAGGARQQRQPDRRRGALMKRLACWPPRCWPAWPCAPLSALAQADMATLNYHLKPRQIAQGTWVIEGAVDDFSRANGCNIINTAFIATGAGVVVINTGTSRLYGEQQRQAIASVTQEPVQRVF